MADQVSVRIAVQGGAEFRGEMQAAGAAGQRALNQIEGATARIGPGFQNAAFQVQDFIVQVAGGTSATRAFAQQAPQLLSGFGAFGAVLGVVAAAAAGLAPALFGIGDGAASAADAMGALDSQASAVQQQISALRDVQEAYVDAINAQGPASAAAAGAVIANSRAEFAVRRDLLEMELDLLRVRGGEARTALEAMQSQVYALGDAIFKPEYRDTRGDPMLGSDSIYAPDPNRAAREREIDDFFRAAELPGLRARREARMIELRELELRRGEDALNTEFSDVGTTSGGTGGGRRGGGGRGGGSSPLADEARKIFDGTRTAAERYRAEVEKLNAVYASGAIDQDTYQRALDKLKADFDATATFMQGVASSVKSALGQLFDSVVEGGKGAGEVLENLAKKLASMALEKTAVDLLASGLPGVFGAGGFLPLVASATGNAFDRGEVQAMAAGGVVTGATMFPLAGGRRGLMGEAGPEAVMPLVRVGGKLGVNAAGAGGGGPAVQIVDMRGQNAPPVEVSRERGPDGREIIVATIREAMARGELDDGLGRFGQRPTVRNRFRS